MDELKRDSYMTLNLTKAEAEDLEPNVGEWCEISMGGFKMPMYFLQMVEVKTDETDPEARTSRAMYVR